MIRNQSQKDRAKDLGLQRKYGITLARQNEIRAEQNNRCKICGVEFTAQNPPCTDHLHFKIKVFRHIGTAFMDRLPKGGWDASAFDERERVICVRWAKTQIAARAEVKQAMMPWSIRGLLCRRCNRGLGYVERYFNATRHPENLFPIIEYLKSRLT